jgi:hypothetical protein
MARAGRAGEGLRFDFFSDLFWNNFWNREFM